MISLSVAEAVLSWHQQVQNHQVVRPGHGHGDGIGAVGRGVGRDAEAAQYPAEDPPDSLLVIHDQHPLTGGALMKGPRAMHGAFRRDHLGVPYRLGWQSAGPGELVPRRADLVHACTMRHEQARLLARDRFVT